MLNLESLSRVLTLSTGIFAGMNLGISCVVVPGILESNDPLPVWKMVYKGASKIAVASLLTSATTATLCFVKNGMGSGSAGFLATGILSFSIIPYTLLMMKPVNDHLFSLNPKEEPKNVKEIVRQWDKLHWVRTIVGILVFGSHVFKIGITT